MEQPSVGVQVVPSARAEIRQRVSVLPDGRATRPLLGAVMLRDQTRDEASAEQARRYASFIDRPRVDVLVITPGRAKIEADAVVLSDGRATVPLLGAVPVRGLSVQEASELLRSGYAAHVPRAQVDVLVTESGGRIKDFFAAIEGNARGPVREVVITSEGRIDLPMLGPVRALDRPLTEVREEIQTAYAELVPEIRTNVLLVRRRIQQITVLGEVQRSGVFDSAAPVSALQALAMAGGPTDRAWLRQVLLIQPDPEGNLDVRVLDFENALRMGKPVALGAQVRPNDLLYVPRSPIADVNVWVEQYIRLNVPVEFGFGFGYTLNND